MTSAIQSYLVDAVIYFNELKTNAIISFNKARSENAIVGVLCNLIDIVVKLLTTAFLWATRLRLEPPVDTPFISLYHYDQIMRNTGENVVLIDLKTSREEFSAKYQNLAVKAKSSGLVNTTLLLARVVPATVRIRLAANANGEKDIIEPFVKSDSQFLSVEYLCGRMQSPISIDIPNSHYIVGNELLSTEYVLRYLEHLPNYVQWEFDEFYKIRVMDENIQRIELKSNQWVLLTKNGYEVCSMKEEEQQEEEDATCEVDSNSSSSPSEPGSPLEKDSEHESDEN